MADYETVIRNTTIATASDVVKANRHRARAGRGAGRAPRQGQKEIDATGLIAVPGGIDAHVHFDQDTADGSVSPTISRAAAGRPRPAAPRPSSPSPTRARASRCATRSTKYHKRAEGKSLIDYAFHVILSDASEKIMARISPPWSPTATRRSRST